MPKLLIGLLFLAQVAKAQLGVDLPFLSGSNTSVTNKCLLDLRTLTNVAVYTDIYSKTTNNVGVATSTNGAYIAGWGDISLGGTNSLLQLGPSSICPIYSTTCGPTNGPCLYFVGGVGNMNLTNKFNGATIPQPVTMCFVLQTAVSNETCFSTNTYDNFSHNTVLCEGTTSSLWDALTFGNNLGSPLMNMFAGNNTTFNAYPGFGYNWSIVTLQYNGTNSIIRINGVTQNNPSTGGTTFSPGANGAPGITYGSAYNGTSPSVSLVAAIFISGDPALTNTVSLLPVEEKFGCEFNITVP